MPDFDALLLVSFGGPEGPADVIPFLENVLRGKNVPRQRMLEVAEHYQQFGGVSPINKQNRALLNAIQEELASHDIPLPVYWGNRNWHPFIPETLQELKRDGHRNILTFMTSAYSSYSGCRQYREDLDRAQKDLGDVTLKFNKLRVFYNHPGFIESFADHLSKSLAQFDTPESVRVLFTAHSIPIAMATHCQYESQLQEACRLVCQTLDHSSFELVYQSRSGPPNQPWLEPDICDRIRELKSETDLTSVIIAPIGFISDHIEILFDLDTEAQELCNELDIQMVRTPTVGIHPRFVRMVRELVEERFQDDEHRISLGTLGPGHDVCPKNCCLSGRSARPSQNS